MMLVKLFYDFDIAFFPMLVAQTSINVNPCLDAVSSAIVNGPTFNGPAAIQPSKSTTTFTTT